MLIGGTREPEVLWVEDDCVGRELACSSVQRALEGVRIHLATSGAEALAWLHRDDSKQSTLPRVVVLDLGLPDVSGLEILRQIRAHPRTMLLPVVVFTSSVDPKTVASCYQAGANSYVVKPTDLQEYVETLVGVVRYWAQTNERLP